MSQQTHPVPKSRESLSGGDCFPFVFGKIAPLESWVYEASTADIKRENYSSQRSYEDSLQRVSIFPRFCFDLFRPSLDSVSDLLTAINEYQGDVAWQFNGSCIEPSAHKGWTAYPPIDSSEESKQLVEKLEEMIRNPPKADPVFVKKAVADIPIFCAFLEKRLALASTEPQDFDPAWLTREGLAQSRPPLAEFFERGARAVFVTRDRVKFATTRIPTSPEDHLLPIGISPAQARAIFNDLSREPDPAKRSYEDPLLPDYPLISESADITNSAFYEPDQIPALLAELLRAQQAVHDPLAIRGLDNFIRICHIAQHSHLGLYFPGL